MDYDYRKTSSYGAKIPPYHLSSSSQPMYGPLQPLSSLYSKSTRSNVGRSSVSRRWTSPSLSSGLGIQVSIEAEYRITPPETICPRSELTTPVIDVAFGEGCPCCNAEEYFADTILKAQQKSLLDQGNRSDLLKMQHEKARLERKQREVTTIHRRSKNVYGVDPPGKACVSCDFGAARVCWAFDKLNVCSKEGNESFHIHRVPNGHCHYCSSSICIHFGEEFKTSDDLVHHCKDNVAEPFRAIILRSYPCQLSLTAMICFWGMVEGAILAFVAERGHSGVWSIQFNIKLVAAFYGAMQSVVAYYVMGMVVKEKGPVFYLAFNPLATVMVAILGSFVLAEQLYLGSVIGAAVIIIGLYLILWGKAKDQSPPSQC